MAEAVVDLLEVVDIHHGQVAPLSGDRRLQPCGGSGHEGASIGDLGQRIDIGLFDEKLGHQVVVQLAVAQAHEGVGSYRAEEQHVEQNQGAF
ncbi:hypothetical protein D3C80_1625000 [compost metagenome]